MNVRICVALAIASCAFSANVAMVPGEAAPDLVVRDASGNAVRLSAYRQQKHVALVAAPTNPFAAADWADASRRLRALDTVVLFDLAPSGTFLIDRTGVVRRVLAGRVLTGADLEQFVELWQSGKTYFRAYCARCHGEDGDSTLCVEKPLTGVGQRLSPEKIRESLRIGEVNDREVLIRGEMIKRFQLEAIIVYVGGL